MSKATMIEQARSQAKRARKGVMPWIYWGVAATFYLYEFFARVGPSVMESTFGAMLDVVSNGQSYSAENYHFALILLPFSIGIGTVLCYWLKETADS